jgi:uncharacterized membrane protein (UPF0127 family)
MKKKKFYFILFIVWFIVFILFWYIFSPVTFYKFYKLFFLNSPPIKIMDNIIEDDLFNNILATSSEEIYDDEGFLIINNNIWPVEIADNDHDRANGLSNRLTLNQKSGMLFLFQTLDRHPFWMKDMLIPIDMVFFDESWQIILIESKIEPNTFPKVFGNKVMSKYVLEINALEAKIFDLKIGDKAIFVNK